MRTQLLASAYDQYDPLVKGFKTIAGDLNMEIVKNCKHGWKGAWPLVPLRQRVD
jgi:hypothetical protein